MHYSGGGDLRPAEAWRALFENWPHSIPKQGLVVTAFAETIPFIDFLISGQLLLLERDVPDVQGTRKVVLAYDQIVALKITAPIELSRFQALGFQHLF